MNKKFILFLISMLLVMSLNACNANSNTAAVAGTETAASTASLTQQLLYGTIGLEGSDYAVDAEQAETLLPLWKAYNALRTDSTVAAEELQGLLNQIKRSMTDEQMAYIEENSFDATSISDLVASLDLNMVGQTTQGRSSEDGFQSSNGAPGGPGGNMPSGGAPMGGGMGMTTGGEQMDTSSMSKEQLAQLQAQREAAGGGMGNNTMYIEVLIELLNQKIAS